MQIKCEMTQSKQSEIERNIFTYCYQIVSVYFFFVLFHAGISAMNWLETVNFYFVSLHFILCHLHIKFLIDKINIFDDDDATKLK